MNALVICLAVIALAAIQFKINLTASSWMKLHGDEILRLYDHLISTRKEICAKNAEIHTRVAELEKELIALKRKVRGEA